MEGPPISDERIVKGVLGKAGGELLKEEKKLREASFTRGEQGRLGGGALYARFWKEGS